MTEDALVPARPAGPYASPAVASAAPATHGGADAARNALALPAQVAELGGFRAIAVLLVLFHHLFYGWRQPPEAFAAVPQPLLSVIAMSWTGVDLFFVLSGLLITGILLDTKSNARYFRNFYARRMLRILPVYFTVITVSWVLYTKPSAYFLLSYAFLSNFAGALGVGIPHGPEVFWSLAIEEHFYLLWPLIVWLTSRRSLALLAIGIVVASPLLRGYCFSRGMDPELQIYFYSWFRLDGLASGALIALWLRMPGCSRKSTLRLAAAVFGAFVLLTLAGTPFGVMGTHTLASTSLRYTQMSWLFASLILAALALHGDAVTAPLRSRFMQWTAALSYCMYLVHNIVGDMYLVALRSLHWDPRALLGPAAAFWLQAAVIVAATYALAALSRRYLENPFLRMKDRFA
jgi:peptidoglycan/LPS O-acetylase OafA/YrhL